MSGGSLPSISPEARHSAGFAERHCRSRLPVYVERLRMLVEIDSGHDTRAGRDDVAELLAAWAAAAGLAAETLDRPSGLFVRAVRPGPLPGRLILLGHHDTVYPAGTAADRPLTIRGDSAFGPGTADMKGGLLVALAALEALLAEGRALPTVELHSVPDEEVRKVPFATFDLVRGADAALVFECGRENGDVVAGRRCGAHVRLRVQGRAAHAGTEPERGRNAAVALCHEALRCAALHLARPGLFVTLGTLSAGSLANVVPAEAEAIFDLRAERHEDLDWALAEMGRRAGHDGIDFVLEQVGRWPGIEATPAGNRLLQAAMALGAELGLTLGGQTSGGMSDGCFTAAAGIPTLDGLGPVGGNDHSPGEYIDLASVAPRCGLAAGLIAALAERLPRG
jgi:glutamate carboxypeptidase